LTTSEGSSRCLHSQLISEARVDQETRKRDPESIALAEFAVSKADRLAGAGSFTPILPPHSCQAVVDYRFSPGGPKLASDL
jgi:hypothetical protein